jgi:hypothetical protein
MAGDNTRSITMTQDGFGYDGPRNCNQWISLGSYQAGPMSPIAIEISDANVSGQPDENSPGRVYADAARLIPASGITLPDVPVAAPPRPRPTQTVSQTPPRPAPQPVQQPTFDPTSISWSSDLNSALRLATSTGKQVVAAFVTSASRDARLMESETWRDSNVIQAVSARYVAVRVSMEQQRQLCARLGVFRSPTTLILQPGVGDPVIVERMVGFVGPSEMVDHLR